MEDTRHSNESKRTDIGVLADIAHALSFIGDWKMRIRNSLCLVESNLPQSKAVCGIDMLGWNFFYCRVAAPDMELEESLLQNYQKLTSETYIEEEITKGRSAVESCITFPIIAAGEIIGVIHVESEIKDAFSVDDISFISVVSTMIGSFAKNVLASDEEAIAKQNLEEYAETATRHVYLLQRALIPSKPWIGHGYDLAYTYLPGVDEIGGDFYDVFKTSDGSVSILIGDVSGKGIPAAALASDTRSAVRAFAFDCSCAGEALERANSALSAQDIEIGMFVTIFIAILNPDTGRVKYACAGQPPPIIYHSTPMDVELLRGGDLPLCIYKDSTYKEYEAYLSPNDKIVLYTDGISEAHEKSAMFGTEGIAQILEEHGEESPQELIYRLISASSEITHGEQKDDIAIIIVQRPSI